jgi:hypothetical protein
MNMPGFNADSSVYRTSGRYYMRGGTVVGSGALYPAQQACPPQCIRRCEAGCRADGNSQSFCRNLCRLDCEAYGGPCAPQFPTPWVCELDPVSRTSTAPCCRICHRLLSPDVGQTFHTC